MGRDEDGADEGMDIDPDDVPTVVAPAGEDPMERARAAIRTARLARGMDPDAPDEDEPEPLPTDPIARAQAVLDRAASARAAASKGGKAGLAREARARDELRRLKALIGDVPTAPDDVDSEPPTAAKPKKRKL